MKIDPNKLKALKGVSEKVVDNLIRVLDTYEGLVERGPEKLAQSVRGVTLPVAKIVCDFASDELRINDPFRTDLKRYLVKLKPKLIEFWLEDLVDEHVDLTGDTSDQVADAFVEYIEKHDLVAKAKAVMGDAIKESLGKKKPGFSGAIAQGPGAIAVGAGGVVIRGDYSGSINTAGGGEDNDEDYEFDW